MNLILSLLLMLVALPAHSASQTVEFYLGETQFSSPDQSTSFGRTQTLMKREYSQDKKHIIETVIQPSRNPTSQYDLFREVWLQEDEGLKYLITDAAKSYSGVVTVEGDITTEASWTYDILMASGEKVYGTGTLSEKGIVVEKQFVRQDILIMNIREELKPVSEREFFKAFKELSGQDRIPRELITSPPERYLVL